MIRRSDSCWLDRASAPSQWLE